MKLVAPALVPNMDANKMSIPNYCIRLTGNDLQEKLESCTGKQMCMILELLSETKEGLTWYAADVTLIASRKEWDIYNLRKPNLIGETDTFKALSRQVEQFTSGVFLGVYGKSCAKQWAKEYETEDLAFIENESAIIEIRAFDTTYFEIYSSDLEFIDPFFGRFGGQLLKATD